MAASIAPVATSTSTTGRTLLGAGSDIGTFRQALSRELAMALPRAHADYDGCLEFIAQWTTTWRTWISASCSRQEIGAPRAQMLYTALAEAVIALVTRLTVTMLAGANGRILRGRFAVLGFGKLGSREMTPSSDLDLVFVYDVPDPFEESDAISGVVSSAYHARLAQRLIRALTVPVNGRACYDVDMRLRPHGDAGPIATSLDGFRNYYRKDAWTWEHMALTRARVVAGDPDFGARVTAEIAEVLTSARDADKLVIDVADMRHRIAEQHRAPTPWDVKYRDGGLIDIEFMVQYGQLLYGPQEPDLLAGSTMEALKRLRDHGYFDASMSAALIDALGFWQQVQASQRALTSAASEKIGDDDLFDRAMSFAADLGSATRRREFAEATAAAVRNWYKKLIETPASLAAQAVAVKAGPAAGLRA